MPETNSQKQEKVGAVVSTKMAKTIVVEVTRRSSHPLYHRVVTRNKKFYAHDEKGAAQMGDIVRIVESRPLSKLKRWKLAEVIRHSRVASAPAFPEAVPAAGAEAGPEAGAGAEAEGVKP